MPRAASMTSVLTSRRPVEALMRIGGIARAVSATRAVSKPKPRNGWQSARIASEGTARPMLPTFTASAAPSAVFLTTSATGSAMAIPISKAATDRSTCWRSNSKKSGRRRTSNIPDILRSPPARPGPEVALQGEEQQVSDNGEGRCEDRAGDDHRWEAAVYAVEDHLPQSPASDVRSYRSYAYDRHGSYADAGYDDGQRQRELDLEEDLARGKPHPARCVYGLCRYGVEPCHGVADQDQERVGHERYDHGRRPYGYPGDGDEDPEEGQAGNGVEQPRYEGDGRVGLAVARDEDPCGERDRERDRYRDEGEVDVALDRGHNVLPEVLGDPVPLHEPRVLDGGEVLQ